MRVLVLSFFIFGLATIGVYAKEDLLPTVQNCICKVATDNSEGNGFFVANQGKIFIITASDIVGDQVQVTVSTREGKTTALVIYVDTDHKIAILEPLQASITNSCVIAFNWNSGRTNLVNKEFPQDMSILCRGIRANNPSQGSIFIPEPKPGTPVFNQVSMSLIGMVGSPSDIIPVSSLKSAIQKINTISKH